MPKATIRDIGSAELTFDSGGTPQVLTPSFGGIKITDTLETAEVKEDGQGDAPVGNVTKGRIVKIEFPATRSTIAQLTTLLFGSAVTTTNELVVSNDVGNDLSDSAVEVLIKPLINNAPSTVEAEWIHIPKCSPPIEKFELTFDNENQRVFMCEMQAYPDASGVLINYGQETP